MGKKDTVTKEYMSENEIFADAFNYFLYDGRQKILGEQLKELDPTEMSIILENDAGETVQKFRDVLRQCIVKEDGKATYLLLGLENQSDLHYAMPVRNMIYDALNYGRQVQQIAARHRKKKDVKGAAFLSGMKKADKLKPVVTLTLFWRADKWDAPRSLHEMLDAEEHILKFVEDYKLNLINFFFMTFPAPIFAAYKRRIFFAKIVRIPRRFYSKRQIYSPFTIKMRMRWKG